MFTFQRKTSLFRRLTASVVLSAFFLSSIIGPGGTVYAQNLGPTAVSVMTLPAPGSPVNLSPAFAPPLLKGLKVYPDEPLRLDFILDKGQAPDAGDDFKAESTRLIKYFLAALTTPEDDLWVNLSPYEKDRIVPDSFGQTEMGRDLLAQDYLLKQITASLLHPDSDVGKQFWARIYAEAQERFGSTDIPVETFNKVWIVPETASVYENAQAGAAYVTEARLRVMLESDYFAKQNNQTQRHKDTRTQGYRSTGAQEHRSTGAPEKILTGEPGIRDSGELAQEIMREIVIPVLEQEVNEGQNFAPLRQVYHSLILATWYKQKIQASLLSQGYVDRNKTAGVEIADKEEAAKIWQRYVEAFQKGAYDFIKEDIDPVTHEPIPRHYFSGGVDAADMSQIVTPDQDGSMIKRSPEPDRYVIHSVRVEPVDWKDGVEVSAREPDEDGTVVGEHNAGVREFALRSEVVRNGLLHESFAAYAMAIKRVVNPENTKTVGVYGGSGVDLANFLLSTNAQRAYFVDMRRVDLSLLREELELWEGDDAHKSRMRRVRYEGISKHGAFDIEKKIVAQLKGMGIRQDDVDVEEMDGAILLKFLWAYPGEVLQTYEIVFVEADITHPEHYPAILETALHPGVDFFYQRAGMVTSLQYDKFIVNIVSHLNEGGFLITDDMALERGSIITDNRERLDAILRENPYPFVSLTAQEAPEVHDAAQQLIQHIAINSPEEDPRYYRYGAILNIRKRVDEVIGVSAADEHDSDPAEVRQKSKTAVSAPSQFGFKEAVHVQGEQAVLNTSWTQLWKEYALNWGLNSDTIQALQAQGYLVIQGSTDVMIDAVRKFLWKQLGITSRNFKNRALKYGWEDGGLPHQIHHVLENIDQHGRGNGFVLCRIEDWKPQKGAARLEVIVADHGIGFVKSSGEKIKITDAVNGRNFDDAGGRIHQALGQVSRSSLTYQIVEIHGSSSGRGGSFWEKQNGGVINEGPLMADGLPAGVMTRVVFNTQVGGKDTKRLQTHQTDNTQITPGQRPADMSEVSESPGGEALESFSDAMRADRLLGDSPVWKKFKELNGMNDVAVLKIEHDFVNPSQLQKVVQDKLQNFSENDFVALSMAVYDNMMQYDHYVTVVDRVENILQGPIGQGDYRADLYDYKFVNWIIVDKRNKNIHFTRLSLGQRDDIFHMRNKGMLKSFFMYFDEILRIFFPDWNISTVTQSDAVLSFIGYFGSKTVSDSVFREYRARRYESITIPSDGGGERVVPDMRYLLRVGQIFSNDRGHENTGGIDLTDSAMDVQIQDGPAGGIEFHFDPALLELLENADGLTPVIIDMQPMTSPSALPAFLGLTEKEPMDKMGDGAPLAKR